MPYYRKRPVTIEARELTPDSIESVAKWANAKLDETEQCIWIATLEGVHRGDYGDFVICGVHNEFYPCKPEIFWKTYEEVGN